jgi:regulator of cell morphogenesis and NO signaling
MTTGTLTIGDSETVNSVVLRYPEALAVFKSFGIDSCCGGALTIVEAATRHGHDPRLVVTAVRNAVAGK